jgi:alginate O-acetyltransferase complex protein AlgI
MITMLLGGLWHGAAWTFVIWGALHGTALLIHREWIRVTEGLKWAAQAMRWLAWPITIYAVCVAWIFFRAHDLNSAGTILKQFTLFHGGGNERFHRWLLLVIVALVVVHWLNSRRWFAESWRRWPAPLFAAAYGCTFAVVLLFVPPHYTPFIYFQF